MKEKGETVGLGRGSLETMIRTDIASYASSYSHGFHARVRVSRDVSSGTVCVYSGVEGNTSRAELGQLCHRAWHFTEEFF